MAYNYNYKFWVFTSQDLNDVLLRQHAVKKIKPKNKLQAHDVLAEIYARYVMLVNNLGYVYDQTCQVQKRALIKRLLMASSKRLLDLRNELKKLELSDFIYLDKTLIQRKCVPKDIQLMCPFYFPYIRNEEIDEIINGPRIEESSDDSESISDDESKKKSDSGISMKASKSIKTTKSDRTKASHSQTTIAEKKDKKDDQDALSVKKSKIRKQKPQPQKEPKPKIEYKKLELINAVTLIKIHEKARRARVFYKNIKLHPDKYAPRPPEIESSIKYDFMHKPDQPMLILIKRTIYEGNYFVHIAPAGFFNYYTKPGRKKKPKVGERESVDQGGGAADGSTQIQVLKEPDYIEQLSVFQNFVKTEKGSFHILADDEPRYAESYFIKGLLQEVGVRFPEGEGSKTGIISMTSSRMRAHENYAAALIQRTWRAYRLRKAAKDRHLKKKILYGMYDNRKWKKDLNKEIKVFQTRQRKRKTWFDQQFIEACENEKIRILKVRGPWIMEDISDHIRAWFREFYDGAKDFHRYPEEIEGGTILLVKGETMTVPEFHAKKMEKKKTKAELKKEAEKRKAEMAKLKAKEMKEKAAAKRKEMLAKKRGGVAINLNTLVTNPEVEDLEKAMKEYEIEWELIDEINNYKEEPYMEWISLAKFDEVHKELRLVVDNLMRIEYELLRKALAKDMKKKYKPQKAKKKKKGKKGKKKKGKKMPKDLTADRSIASLYYEMEDIGLIKKYARRNFDDFVGDYNYCAYEIRNYLDKDSEPSLGEIKDILREWIIGMGPLDLPKARSICFAGPISSGKRITLEILATELDAVMFDLSPEIVVKYEEKMPYLIHLVNKMARILQPTIINISGVHRVFWKKIPKDSQELKPRLLAKHLSKKIVKSIKKEEKILVVGLTDAPWQAKAQMKKCFEKFLLMPKTDYATAFLLWRSVALSKIGFPRDFEFSPLAMVTQNYMTGDICNNINEVLNIKRRVKLSIKPITHMELLEGFLSRPEPLFPPKETEFKKYIKWYLRVNKLAKQRQKYMKVLELAREKEKAKLAAKAAKK